MWQQVLFLRMSHKETSVNQCREMSCFKYAALLKQGLRERELIRKVRESSSLRTFSWLWRGKHISPLPSCVCIYKPRKQFWLAGKWWFVPVNHSNCEAEAGLSWFQDKSFIKQKTQKPVFFSPLLPKLCPSAWKYLIKGKMYDLRDTWILYITVEPTFLLRRVMGYIYPAGLGGFE